MSGVESLAVSSIINVHDSSDMTTSSDEDVTSHHVASTSTDPLTSSICVKMAPLLIAVSSFAVCSAILIYLCSKKPKTIDLESEIGFQKILKKILLKFFEIFSRQKFLNFKKKDVLLTALIRISLNYILVTFHFLLII